MNLAEQIEKQAELIELLVRMNKELLILLVQHAEVSEYEHFLEAVSKP